MKAGGKMANHCAHEHFCVECKKPTRCWKPECLGLGLRTHCVCERCSHYHGGAQARFGKAMDE
jgi:hypothetical protein